MATQEESQEFSLKDFQNVSDFQDEDNNSNSSLNMKDPFKNFKLQKNQNSQQNGQQLPINIIKNSNESIQKSIYDKIQDKKNSNNFDFLNKFQDDKNNSDPRKLKQNAQIQQISSPTFEQLSQIISDCKDKIRSNGSISKYQDNTLKKIPFQSQEDNMNGADIQMEKLNSSEYLEYLNFREQVHLKRLIELRHDHSEFQKTTLVQLNEKIKEKIIQLFEKAKNSSKEMLFKIYLFLFLSIYKRYQNQETEVRYQLTQIQNLIKQAKQGNFQKVIQPLYSPKENIFEKLQKSIDSICDQIDNWNYKKLIENDLLQQQQEKYQQQQQQQQQQKLYEQQQYEQQQQQTQQQQNLLQQSQQKERKNEQKYEQLKLYRERMMQSITSHPNKKLFFEQQITPSKMKEIQSSNFIQKQIDKDEPDLDKILKRLQDKQKQQMIEDQFQELGKSSQRQKMLNSNYKSLDKLLVIQKFNFNVKPSDYYQNKSPFRQEFMENLNKSQNKRQDFKYLEYHRDTKNKIITNVQSPNRSTIKNSFIQSSQKKRFIEFDRLEFKGQDFLKNKQIGNDQEQIQFQRKNRNDQYIISKVQNALSQQQISFFNSWKK